MIKTVELVKMFGEKAALNGLTTTIEPGHIYGLVGPNGSGKSTLMRLISGIYRADGGSLELDGEQIFENPVLKERIFLLPDDCYWLPKHSVDDMAAFYASVYPCFSWERYNSLKSCFPIDCTKRFTAFSKGQRRQAALMTALACNCEYLLLDEAFDGLDPVIRLLVKKLLAEMIADKNVTVIITSHNLRELEDLCDQIGLIHNGKLLLQRDLDELRLGFCKVQLVLEQQPDWKQSGLEILHQSQKGSVISLLVRGGAEETLLELNRYRPVFSEAVPLTLEEVFIGEMEAVGYDFNRIIR